MRIALLFFIVTLAISCSRQPVIPADEATPGERAKIEQTTKEIESLFRGYGNTTNVHSLPIIVTSENVTAAERDGYCAKTDGQRSLYIALNRSLFELERREPLIHAVFLVLLHEFGHCYFQRQHEQTVIRRDGFEFAVATHDTQWPNLIFFAQEFPVSVMYQKKTGEGISPAFLIQEFQSYYAGELIGYKRITSLEELAMIPAIQIRDLRR